MSKPLFYQLLLFCSLLLVATPGLCQKEKGNNGVGKNILQYDTIMIPAGIYFITPSSYFLFKKDTTVVLSSFRKLSSDELNELRTEVLYDSLYTKFSRNRISKLLYDLAFVPPQVSSLPDTVQAQKIEVPFLQYKGMHIRSVQIMTMDPFGTSIYDTEGVVQSRAASFGNAIHLTTRKSVIRSQLMFHEGEAVNPEQIADNERILRDLPYISGARIVISETAPGSDTVDIAVITKDNWSIGGSLSIIELSRYRGSLYDANFLGSGDRLSVNWSVDYERAPFLRVDGISYNFTNISGSFIDGLISLNQDDDGNQTLEASLSRPFFSYSTQVAGGINFTLAKSVTTTSSDLLQIAMYHQEGAWLGLSAPVSSSDPAIRFVLAQSYFSRHYFSRPFATIDSNAGFYNTTTILSSIQLSKNKYYNTDYILQFGKTEAFPYGFLGQVTCGVSINDFYSRIYLGLAASAGNFIKKFGYLYGGIHLGGYLHGNAVEDGLLKIQSSYLSYLYFTPSRRYKFRSYVTAQYNCLFYERINNQDYFDLAEAADIKSVDADTIFDGSQVAWLSFSTIAYTPWYFYGFRFAFRGSVWAGLSAPKNTSLWKSPFMTGIGIGLMLKNDNLIFPTLMITCFVYPTTPGVPLVQFDIFETGSVIEKDFSPTAPYIQTMRN